MNNKSLLSLGWILESRIYVCCLLVMMLFSRVTKIVLVALTDANSNSVNFGCRHQAEISVSQRKCKYLIIDRVSVQLI